MGDYLMRTVPILFITVAAYGLWRRHLTDKQIISCEGNLLDISLLGRSLRCSTIWWCADKIYSVKLFYKLMILPKSNIAHQSTSVPFSSTGECCLDELPNDVWPYILSLLSLRDVARLATLSRNMRNVCLLLPHLDLDWCVMLGLPEDFLHAKECKNYKAAYVKIVDQVLQNYRDQTIFSLRLTCCLDDNHTDDVNRWINIAAANKHLQSLFLRFSCMVSIGPICSLARCNEELKSISSSLFSQITSLRELRLHCCILKADIDLKLSNLTILDLTDVVFEGAKWQGFLASSSTIERLYLRWCSIPNKLCIGDNFPQLSFLNISFCRNLQGLELSARNLTTIEFEFTYDVECSFFNVPRLENVGLYMTTGSYRTYFLNLAANASSLKHVFLHSADYLGDILPSPEARFLMPALSLHMIMDAADIAVKALPNLLKYFPFLRRLELQLPTKSSGDEYKLPYVLENLKEVRLFGFQVEWIPVATFFLQSARLLDRLVLTKARDRSSRLWGYESRCFTGELLVGYEHSEVSILSKKECNYIQNALKGKAISATAEVIIENLQQKQGQRNEGRHRRPNPPCEIKIPVLC